jgi:predicted tellurium resistance membrane protein TerC
VIELRYRLAMHVAELLTAENLLALLTLTALEIVLGIDNIVFIAILSGKLPPEQRDRARRLGLLAAMGMRILLLLSLSWIMSLTRPLLTIGWLGEAGAFTGKDLILLVGGVFLIGKATHEIHDKLEGEDGHESGGPARVAKMGSVIIQIMLMDIIFSLDSVITAVGMVEQKQVQVWWHPLTIMIAAVMIAVGVMMIFARSISDFVERHPTIKMLALSFLILIGLMLVADAFNKHIPKGYIYFAMAFSLGVEMLNLRLRKSAKRVQLHQPRLP